MDSSHVNSYRSVRSPSTSSTSIPPSPSWRVFSPPFRLKITAPSTPPAFASSIKMPSAISPNPPTLRPHRCGPAGFKRLLPIPVLQPRVFTMARARLTGGSAFATQATIHFFATQTFWCIARTLKDTEFSSVIPYHTLVVSIGDWESVVASHRPMAPNKPVVEAPGVF